MKRINLICTLIIFFLIQVISTNAQSLSSKDIVDVKAQISGKDVLVLQIELKIKKGWHINSDQPFDEYLNPTKVTLKDSSLFANIQTEYPAPEIIKLDFSQTDLSLYRDQVLIKVILTPKKELINKELKIDGSVSYQLCNDQTCLFPTKKPFSVVFKQ